MFITRESEREREEREKSFLFYHMALKLQSI